MSIVQLAKELIHLVSKQCRQFRVFVVSFLLNGTSAIELQRILITLGLCEFNVQRVGKMRFDNPLERQKCHRSTEQVAQV